MCVPSFLVSVTGPLGRQGKPSPPFTGFLLTIAGAGCPGVAGRIAGASRKFPVVDRKCSARNAPSSDPGQIGLRGQQKGLRNSGSESQAQGYAIHCRSVLVYPRPSLPGGRRSKARIRELLCLARETFCSEVGNLGVEAGALWRTGEMIWVAVRAKGLAGMNWMPAVGIRPAKKGSENICD